MGAASASLLLIGAICDVCCFFYKKKERGTNLAGRDAEKRDSETKGREKPKEEGKQLSGEQAKGPLVVEANSPCSGLPGGAATIRSAWPLVCRGTHQVPLR
jgi:hypothetical protein